MKYILLVAAAFVGFGSASAQDISFVINALVKGTELVPQASPACDKVEAARKDFSYPSNKTSNVNFIKTYKFIYPTIIDSYVKYSIEQSILRYKNVKWYTAEWEPFRAFDVTDAKIDNYTFYVNVIAAKDEELAEINYTAVCITALKLR